MVNVFFGYSSHYFKDLFCHFVDDTHVMLSVLGFLPTTHTYRGKTGVTTYGTYLLLNFVYYHVVY